MNKQQGTPDDSATESSFNLSMATCVLLAFAVIIGFACGVIAGNIKTEPQDSAASLKRSSAQTLQFKRTEKQEAPTPTPLEPVEPVIAEPEETFQFADISPLYEENVDLGESPLSVEPRESIDSRLSAHLQRITETLSLQLQSEIEFRNSDQAWEFLGEIKGKLASEEPTPSEIQLGRFYREFSIEGLLEERPLDEVRNDASRVVEFDRWLRTKGIRLIYCPMPNPVDVDACQHLRKDTFVSLMPNRTHFLLQLAKQGVLVADLRNQFGQASLSGRFPFHRYDHHPTPIGLELSAKSVAEIIVGNETIENPRFSTRFVSLDEPHISISHKAVPEGTRFGTTFAREVIFDGKPVLQNAASPILVMCDSMVLHLSRERSEFSADFTSHLARHIGIPLRFHGRSGDPGAVPTTFADYLLMGNAKPRFLVWIRDGATASPSIHPDIDPTNPGSFSPGSKVTGEHEIEILEIAVLPDPQTATYSDCLLTFEFKTVASDMPETKGTGIVWGFKNRKTISYPWLIEGNRAKVVLTPYADKIERQRTLDTLARTETRNFLLQRYFVDHNGTAIPNGDGGDTSAE